MTSLATYTSEHLPESSGKLVSSFYSHLVSFKKESISHDREHFERKHLAPKFQIDSSHTKNEGLTNLDDLTNILSVVNRSSDSIKVESLTGLFELVIFKILDIVLDQTIDQLHHVTDENIESLRLPFTITLEDLNEVLSHSETECKDLDDFKEKSEDIALIMKMKEVLELYNFVKSRIIVDEDSESYSAFLNDWAGAVVKDSDSIAFKGSSIEEYRKHILNEL